MLSLFDTIYNDDNYEDIRPRYLGACSQLSCFAIENPKIVENVVGKINSYLYEPDKQIQGLVILQTVVNQCPLEIFAKNTVTWLTLITRILQKDGSAEKKRMALIVAKRILLYLTSFPELRKQITEMSQTLVLSVLKSSKELEKESMDCLAECLKLLPGQCGIIKAQIEQHIWSLLIEMHHGIKEEVCTCFALLPTCGASGNRNATHISNWQNQMSRILSTLHIILNHVFEGIEVDGPNYSSTQNGYNLPDVSDNPYSALFKYSHYFDALSLCMVKMLSTEYCFKVKIPIEEILSFVYRVLAVNNRMILNRSSSKMSALSAVLPSFYCAAITILRSLILSCQKLLFPYCDSILKSLIRTLQQTSDGSSSLGSNRPYSFLRSIIYDSLSILLQKITTGSIVEQHIGPVVEQILLDIKPERIVTKLQHSSAKGSKGKNRRRGNLHSATTGAVNFAKDLASNQITCKQALKSMKALLHTAGNVLKPNIYKELHTTIVTLILEVQQNPLNSPAPYNKHCCRLELYSVLLAFLLNPSLDQLLPIQTAVSMFSIGRNDSHVKVAELCSTALSVCSSIIHPQASVIQRPYFTSRPENASGYGISPMTMKNAPNYFDQRNLTGHNEENGRTMLNYLSQDRSLQANAEMNIQDTVITPMIVTEKPDEICYKEIQQDDTHSELNGFSILPSVESPCRENGSACDRDGTVFIDASHTPQLPRSCDKVIDVSCVPQLPNNSENIVDVTCSPQLQNSCEKIIEIPCVPQLSNSCEEIIDIPRLSSSCDKIIDVPCASQLSSSDDKFTDVSCASQLSNSCDKMLDIQPLSSTCDKNIDIPYTQQLLSSHDKLINVTCTSQLPNSCDNVIEITCTSQLPNNHDSLIDAPCTSQQLSSSCDDIVDITCVPQLTSNNNNLKDSLQPSETSEKPTDESYAPHSSVSCEKVADLPSLQMPVSSDNIAEVTSAEQVSNDNEEAAGSLSSPHLPTSCAKDTDDVSCMSNLPNSCDSVDEKNVLTAVNCTKEMSPVHLDEEISQVSNSVASRKRHHSDDKIEEHDAPKKKPIENAIEVSEQQLGIEEMVQDFVPASPDKE